MNASSPSKRNPAPGGPPAADIVVTGVDVLPEYVIGFPVDVAITVRAAPGEAFRRIPFADLTGMRECVGVTASDARGVALAKYQPTPIVAPEMGLFGEPLEAGESRRMLTDVSPLLDTLPPGEFVADFTYVTPGARYPAPRVKLRLRAPTAAETAVLAAVAAERRKTPNWSAWVITPPEKPFDPPPVTADNPLRFDLLLRRLFYGPDPLDRINPAMLDVLDGLYRPEAQALKAELLHARGKLAEYHQLHTQILRDSPGLAWWLRMIDESGGGYLKNLRMNV